MSALGMHPRFTDQNGYIKWRAQWRSIYKELSHEIRRRKKGVKGLQGQKHPMAPSRMMRELQDHRVMASKMMTLMKDAKLRWKRINAMKDQIADQMRQFPMMIEAPVVDFHFNKISAEFPFMPAWVIKAKGKSWYMHHVDFECVGTTRETPDHPSTKGAIRFRKVVVSVRPDGSATIASA